MTAHYMLWRLKSWGTRKNNDYDWCEDNTKKVDEAYAHQVAEKKPNPWGLHDIHGNVWEWCRDWYQDFVSGGTDPEVTTMTALRSRVYRGGSWRNTIGDCASKSRRRGQSRNRLSYLGFRVAAGKDSRKGVFVCFEMF